MMVMLKAATIAAFLTIFLSAGLRAQDSVRSAPRKGKVTIRIRTDADGKTTSLDTTFILSGPGSQQEFRDYMRNYMKKYEENMAGMKDEMKDLEDQMKDMEINVTIPDLDSLGSDSLSRHMIVVGRAGRSSHPHGRDMEREYEYKYEMPQPPEPPDFHFNWGEGPEGAPRIFQYEDRDKGTLNELLGPIPLDQVQQYRIIERKGGKRIIIDLNNAPLPPKGEKKVIIIHGDDEQGPHGPKL